MINIAESPVEIFCPQGFRGRSERFGNFGKFGRGRECSAISVPLGGSLANRDNVFIELRGACDDGTPTTHLRLHQPSAFNDSFLMKKYFEID
jgi:hypothetical protein